MLLIRVLIIVKYISKIELILNNIFIALLILILINILGLYF